MKREIGALLAVFLLLSVFLLGLCAHNESSGMNEASNGAEEKDIPTGGEKEYVSVDGQWFYESDYFCGMTVPEGYDYKYTISSGYFSHYELFASERNPMWVYLKKESDPSCVKRMVDNRIWGKKFISYQNKVYIAVSTIYGRQDVEKDIWDNREKIYYSKEELGEANSIGVADFSGYDTIPTGILASNQPELEVFGSSEYSSSMFVSVPSETHSNDDMYERYVCWQWDF